MIRSAARRTATVAAVLASAAAVAYLLLFLFGPSYTGCSTGIVTPTSTPGPTTCKSVGWLELTLSDPAPIRDFRALWFLGAWTLAPLVAAVATRLHSSGLAISIIALATLVELSSIISMGGGFVYAILCGPLLLIALFATATSRMGSFVR